MPEESDFNSDQIRILELLPKNARALAEEFDTTVPAIRKRVQRINEKWDQNKVEANNGQYVWTGGDEIHRLTSRNKGSITKDANKALTRLERDEKNALAGVKDPNLPPIFTDAPEDMVVHRSDSHIGQIVLDQFNRRLFDVEICLRREREINRELIKLAKKIKRERDVGTLYYLLGGDTVTNENIYDEQPFEIEITLDKQIDLAADLFLNNIKKLSPHFEKIVVVMQGGNHGELRANGQSKKANADDIAYARLELLIKENQVFNNLTNVRVVRNDSTNYINFGMRVDPDTKEPKWRAHMRHGQDSLFHIGTSSGFNRWKSWLDKNNFDIAYRGHYHSFRIERVMGRPVVMGGSVCPAGEYEDSLGVGESPPAAIIHGITDDEIMPWFRQISFDHPHEDSIIVV